MKILEPASSNCKNLFSILTYTEKWRGWGGGCKGGGCRGRGGRSQKKNFNKRNLLTIIL